MSNSQQAVWLEKLEYERLNLRAALEWSVESPAGVEAGLRLAGALRGFWEIRSHLKQAREHYTAVLNRPGAEKRTAVRANALTGAGRLAWCQDDDEQARIYFNEALGIFRELGMKTRMGFVLAYLGFVERSEGETEKSREYFDECSRIAEELNDPLIFAIMQSGKGTLAADDGDLNLARELKEKALKFYRTTGDSYVVSLLTWSLSRVVTALGDFSTARSLLEECVTINRQLGNKWSLPYLLEGIADVSIGEKNAKHAAKLYGAAEVLREKIGLAMPPTERVTYNKARDSMREALTEETFKTVWNEGRAMTVEQALAYALGR